MIATADPSFADRARGLRREAHEPHLIFASIFRELSTKRPPEG
jgi:hypothetical protein